MLLDFPSQPTRGGNWGLGEPASARFVLREMVGRSPPLPPVLHTPPNLGRPQQVGTPTNPRTLPDHEHVPQTGRRSGPALLRLRIGPKVRRPAAVVAGHDCGRMRLAVRAARLCHTVRVVHRSALLSRCLGPGRVHRDGRELEVRRGRSPSEFQDLRRRRESGFRIHRDGDRRPLRHRHRSRHPAVGTEHPAHLRDARPVTARDRIRRAVFAPGRNRIATGGQPQLGVVLRSGW